MIGRLQVADRAGRAGDVGAAGDDDLHPATSVGPQHGGREIIVHRVQDAARLGLRGEVRDRAVIDAQGIGGDGDHGEDDHHHDGGGHHHFEQGEAGAEGAEHVFHRLMTMFWTTRGVSARVLNSLNAL